MAITSDTEKLLWDTLLDADMSHRYYVRLSGRLSRLETGLSIVTAVLTSGAFLSLALSSPLPGLAKWFALAATITSTWLVFSKHGKRAEFAASRARGWMDAQARLERLWARRGAASDDQVHRGLEQLQRGLSEGAEAVVRELPLNDRLRRSAYREVLDARGLAHG